LFFGAYIDKQNAAEKSEVNVRILKNLLDALAETPLLRHITIFQGGKAYGSDLGPYKTTAREDDPRMMSPNYYYDQEDLLRTRQKGSKWNFTVLRPGGAICGPSLGSPLNLISVIGIRNDLSRDGLATSLSPVPRRHIERCTRSHPPTCWLAPRCGRARRRLHKTRSSTSPMATLSAGSICGRG
jgi:hypothetical protein